MKIQIVIADIEIIIICFIISIFVYIFTNIFKKYGHIETKLDQLKIFDKQIKTEKLNPKFIILKKGESIKDE